MTAIGIGERLWRKEVHWKAYVSILGGLLFVAFYTSWRDMRIALNVDHLGLSNPKAGGAIAIGEVSRWAIVCLHPVRSLNSSRAE